MTETRAKAQTKDFESFEKWWHKEVARLTNYFTKPLPDIYVRNIRVIEKWYNNYFKNSTDPISIEELLQAAKIATPTKQTTPTKQPSAYDKNDSAERIEQEYKRRRKIWDKIKHQYVVPKTETHHEIDKTDKYNLEKDIEDMPLDEYFEQRQKGLYPPISQYALNYKTNWYKKAQNQLPIGTVVISDLYKREGNIKIIGIDEKERYEVLFTGSGRRGKINPEDVTQIISQPQN